MNKGISIITILHGEEEFIPLIKDNFNNFNYPKDKLELVVIDDGAKSLLDYFLDDRILYLHISEKEIKEFLEKIEIPNDKEKLLWNYLFKTKQLPNGFKRDYGVGMSSNDIYFHMDYDTCYNKDSINRKLKYMEKHKVECVYNSSILCHDFHNHNYIDENHLIQ